MSAKEWDGTLFRTSINKSVYSELYEELEKLPSNLRSKRLVVLATLGQAFLANGAFHSSSSTSSSEEIYEGFQESEFEDDDYAEEDESFAEERNVAKNKLLGSLTKK